MDLIDRQAAIDVICQSWCGCQNADCKHHFDPDVDEYYWCDGCSDVEELKNIPSAEPKIAENLYLYKCYITDKNGLQHEVIHTGDIRRVTGWEI